MASGMDLHNRLAALSDDQAALLDGLLAEAAREGRAEPDQTHPGPKAVLVQNGSGGLPLFIVHGSGGRVMFLRAVARCLAAIQTVYGLEAGTAADAADADACGAYLRALQAVQPKGPYRLGGYSAGCLIAFEVAARLQAMGEAVEFLLFIDPIAVPDTGVGEPPSQEPAAPRERLRSRFEIAALAGVTPLSPEFAYVEQVNRQLSLAARRFQPRPLDLRIHLIQGLPGDYTPTAESVARWAMLAGRGLERATVEADHFEIVRDPHAAATARQIQIWLRELPPPADDQHNARG
jgi:thioesterase domain-containing protein